MPESGQRIVDSAGPLPERPRVASPTPLPASGALPPAGTVWHRVEVIITTHPSGESLKRIVEGDDTWVAASLRVLADQLDPPKPPRPNLRTQPDPAAGGMVRRGPQGGLVSVPPPSGTGRNDPMSTR
jgi:hypothetical protein